MRKVGSILLINMTFILLLSGCHTPITQDSQTKPSVSVSHKTKETTEKVEKTSETTREKLSAKLPQSSESAEADSLSDKLNQLPDSIKAQVYTQVVDSRMDTYAGLEKMELTYDFEGDDIYVHLTSGAGTGHPIYHLYKRDAGIEPLQGVYYSGIDGNLEAPVERDIVSDDVLYEYYETNKEALEQGVRHTKEDSALKDTFEEYIKSTGSVIIGPDEKAGQTTDKLNPSQEDKLHYFKEYILADLGQEHEVTKEQTHYGYGDNPNPEADELVIRMPGSQGYYVTMDGSRIIYTGYSFGGANADGTSEKRAIGHAFYDVVTGEHGVFD